MRHFEDAIDIEDDHELPVQSVDTTGKLGHAGIEVDGIFLAAVVGQRQHLADLIDQIGEVLTLPDDSREENPVNLDPRMAKLAGGVHRLDGQLMVVLDVDRVLELLPAQLAV